MPEYDTSESVCMTIVDNIAEEEGVHPLDLEPPLQSILDTDALENLVTDDNTDDLRVEFQYHGYEVTVMSDGGVDVNRR